ncbi:hypothetical protein A0H81_14616 [Grifola frondosa]|uniref:Uncharacterized protein n=1 Tax=Grifola frondosa TaxID=5627 RepID=A0A1C7LL53_GRIFR|nr:hypothetical protein A0H81_14616 [Grifola frondosa]
MAVHLVVHQGDVLVTVLSQPRWNREYDARPMNAATSCVLTKFVLFDAPYPLLPLTHILVTPATTAYYVQSIPQRTRKLQAHLSAQGSMQTIAQREMSPSPTFRERQRAVKAHSMPAVPSSRPRHFPSAPLALLSQPIVSQIASQTAPNPHHPRPVTRVPPPQFLTQYQTPDEKWQVTEELMAEFEREQSHAGQFSHPAGTSGVAYAGGAASSNINLHLQQSARDPAVERVRASDRASPKDSDGSSGGQITTKRQVRDKEQPPRESPKTRDRSATVTSLSSHTGEPPSAANRTPEYRGSPQYQTPMASPNERTATYTQYVPDSYQAATAQQAPSPSAPRKSSTSVTAVDSASSRLTPPATSKLASHTPPLLQAMAPRPLTAHSRARRA